MCRFASSLIAAFFALSATVMASAAEPALPPLILAVHPYLPSTEIQQRFAPLADYLGKQLGRQIQVRVGRDYDQHIDAIGLNSVDITYMGPAPYVKMVSLYGAKPLLARIEVNGKPMLSGYIITTVDSPLRSLGDLRGKRFAFTDPESTMGTIVPRYMLQQAGVGLKQLGSYQHLGGHKDVALGVLSGDFDAGAVKAEVYEEMAPRGLRVLARLPEVSEHLFIARADMPAKQVASLRRALLQLKNAPMGPAILQGIHKGMTNMVPVIDADYDSLRKLERAVDARQE